MILRDRGGEADKWKISASGNPLTALLIRRAPRATFPDMGRLTDSLLPTTEVKIAKQFCLYSSTSIFNLYPLTAYYIAIIQLYCITEYVALLKVIAFSPSIDGSEDNSSLPMSGKVAREARRMRR